MAELVPNVAQKRPRLVENEEMLQPSSKSNDESVNESEDESGDVSGEDESEDEGEDESEGESGNDSEDESDNTGAKFAKLKKHYAVAKFVKLKKQVRKLEQEVSEWRQRAEAAEAALDTEDTVTMATMVPPSLDTGSGSATATNGKSIISMPDQEHPFGISVMLPDNYVTDPIGTVYKHTHIRFPHRIIGNKDGRDRIFVVESRPNITITARLFNWITKDRATEYDVSPTGLLKLKLEVLFADTHEVVKVSDLGKSTYHLFNPPEEQIAEKRMVAGEVSWTFKCQFSSRATKNPSNRDFLFRVRCTNPELSHIEQLTFTTPFSFKVISRQYNRVGTGSQ